MTSETIVEKTNHIPSSVYRGEQDMWLQMLHGLPDKPLIVDFGTGWGKSAASLALACPQAHVYTFDTGTVYLMHHNVESYADYAATVEKYIRESGATNVDFKVQSSLEIDVPEFLRNAGYEAIDVLNIDSDHSYEQTLVEIKRWVPFVKPGGLIFLHDWEHPKAPGVTQAFNELLLYKAAVIPEKFWGLMGDHLEYNRTEQRDVPGNIPKGDMVAEVEFLEKANSPVVTTAAFRKIA